VSTFAPCKNTVFSSSIPDISPGVKPRPPHPPSPVCSRDTRQRNWTLCVLHIRLATTGSPVSQGLAVRSISQSVARHLGHASATLRQQASPAARASAGFLCSCLRSPRNARAGRAVASLAQPAPALLGGSLGVGCGHQQTQGHSRLGTQTTCRRRAGFGKGRQSSPGLSLVCTLRQGLALGTKPGMQFAPGSSLSVFGRRRVVTKEKRGSAAHHSVIRVTRGVVVANPSVELTNCSKLQFAAHLER
jgi:hypothetical protein